jgi:hypothetical protein
VFAEHTERKFAGKSPLKNTKETQQSGESRDNAYGCLPFRGSELSPAQGVGIT